MLRPASQETCHLRALRRTRSMRRNTAAHGHDLRRWGGAGDSLDMTTIRRFGLTAALTLIASPALAHHPMGGETPSTLFQGLASGVGHPIIGLDHFAFVLAAGAAAALIGRVLPLALAFAAATVIGLVIHLNAYTLPWAEIVIAGSAALAGLLLLTRRAPGLVGWTALFGIAGIVHAYAYAEAIIGAEATPLVAYAVGLALTQGAIVFAVAWALRAIAASSDSISLARGAQAIGGVSMAIGLVFLAQAVA